MLTTLEYCIPSAPADAGTRGREWLQVVKEVKQQEVENRPTQSGRDLRARICHVSHCRTGSLADFHCMVGAGPEK